MSNLKLIDQNGNDLTTNKGDDGKIVIMANGEKILTGSPITINGTVIDAIDGYLYSLTKIWQCSGYGEHKKPSQWLRLSTTQDLLTTLDQAVLNLALRDHRVGSQRENISHIHTVNGGIHRGTYGSIMVLLAYATWISSSFHLKVLSGWMATNMNVESSLELLEERGQVVPDGFDITIKEFTDKYNASCNVSVKTTEMYKKLIELGLINRGGLSFGAINVATNEALKFNILSNASVEMTYRVLDNDTKNITTAFVPSSSINMLIEMVKRS